MVLAMMKRPTIWAMPGGTYATIRAAFTNDGEVDTIDIYRATSATATDANWTLVESVSKPGSVTNPYVETVDTSTAQSATAYYRAAQVATSAYGDFRSEWSNVIRNDQPTFLYELRDGEGLLRGVQFEADTDNATRGITWFEAMEIMLQEHIQAEEMLRRFSLTDANIEDIWESPPHDIVRYVAAKVAESILTRSSLSTDDQDKRLSIAKVEARIAWHRFKSDGRIILSNGEEIVFKTNSVGLA